jgi:hypothetical protein
LGLAVTRSLLPIEAIHGVIRAIGSAKIASDARACFGFTLTLLYAVRVGFDGDLCRIDAQVRHARQKAGMLIG